MNSRLVVEVEEVDGYSVVRVVGAIDEDNDIFDTTRRITQDNVIINTANVERINSCGVRDWVRWIKDLDDKVQSYCFVECSPAIMTQVNSVNNFTGDGAIVSFFAPYYCGACEKDKMLLVDTATALKSKRLAAPSCRCDECDQQMEFDDLESSYFRFLRNKKFPELDAETRKMISKISAGQRIRSRTTEIPLMTSPGSMTPSSKQLWESMSKRTMELARSEPRSMPKLVIAAILGMLFASVALLGYIVYRNI